VTAVGVFSPTRTEDGRRGKVFSIRLDDETRAKLAALARKAEEAMPWSYERRRGSIGGFVVWAALQWKSPDEKISRKLAAGASPPKEDWAAVAARVAKRRRKRRVVPRRRRRGTTALQGKKRGKKGGRK
jgi:predicted transcriptional regulator